MAQTMYTRTTADSDCRFLEIFCRGKIANQQRLNSISCAPYNCLSATQIIKLKSMTGRETFIFEVRWPVRDAPYLFPSLVSSVITWLKQTNFRTFLRYKVFHNLKSTFRAKYQSKPLLTLGCVVNFVYFTSNHSKINVCVRIRILYTILYVLCTPLLLLLTTYTKMTYMKI